ncbi:MAG TPA: mannitol dehydrogenase family protein [Solirubrobacteraceae bacterium]|nr:mannitol dehydrogenase family protein [Solirubrobacteraceae bacterium]
MRPLHAGTLSAHAARVAVPTYDRSALTPAVVHISVGSFHRSHQAVYFDDIAERRISSGWGLVGVGLHRPEMRDVLTAQDGLYTVVARGADGDRARVIGAIRRYLFAPEQGTAVVAALADARTRLVTLTVTAHGYASGVDSGAAPPADAVEYLVAGLDGRRRAGLPPFTVLSCDNVPDNGVVARDAVLGAAERRDPALARWIGAYGAFPSSMVDRITPRTTPADQAFVRQRFGVADRWPVITEPFSQWVIEDDFCAGRPPLDRVGAELVADVRPYALTKSRLLNASHCALGHLGSLAGHLTTDRAIGDPLFDAYIAQMTADEVTPLLPRIPGVDPAVYRAMVRARLANPKLADQLARLCRNASAKLPVHVLPSIAEARRAGRPHDLLTLAVAGWLRYLQSVDAHGRDLPLDDPLGDRLRALARAGGTDPRPVLAERVVFGDLGLDPAFASELSAALEDIARSGVRAAIRARLSATDRLAA